MVVMSFEDQWSPGQVRLADGSVEEVKVAEFTAGTRQFDALPRSGRQAIRQCLQEHEVVRWVDKPVEKAKFYFALFFAIICAAAMVFHAPSQGELVLFAIVTITGLLIVFLCDRQQAYVITNKRLMCICYAWTRRRDPIDFAVPLSEIASTQVAPSGTVEVVTTAGTKHQLWLLEDPRESVRQIELARRRLREA
jgi:uncharacterized membrane protein